jgi:hypothetical protein
MSVKHMRIRWDNVTTIAAVLAAFALAVIAISFVLGGCAVSADIAALAGSGTSA